MPREGNKTGPVERKLLLAYVNNCRQISSCDKELHKDFFYFNMIMKDEFNSRLDMVFDIVSDQKGKVVFENEPFCHNLEMLVAKLIKEGKLAFVEAGVIDITQEGYNELVELRKVVDPIAPSVKYMKTRMGDKKYEERFRKTIQKKKQPSV